MPQEQPPLGNVRFTKKVGGLLAFTEEINSIEIRVKKSLETAARLTWTYSRLTTLIQAVILWD